MNSLTHNGLTTLFNSIKTRFTFLVHFCLDVVWKNIVLVQHNFVFVQTYVFCDCTEHLTQSKTIDLTLWNVEQDNKRHGKLKPLIITYSATHVMLKLLVRDLLKPSTSQLFDNNVEELVSSYDQVVVVFVFCLRILMTKGT